MKCNMSKKLRKWSCYVALLAIGMCIALSSCKKAGISEKAKKEQAYSRDIFAMDTYMSLTAYGEHGEEAVKAAEEEIHHLDNIWSIVSKDGEVYNINKKGTGEISKDTKTVLEYAKRLNEETEGAFDVTIYPLMDLWGFTTQKYHVPTKEELRQAMARVGQEYMTIEDDTLTLGEQQQMDLGGIAKGYTSSRIMEIFKEHGVTSGMVSLGGNVQVLGTKVNGDKWNVGIRNPKGSDGELIGAVSVADRTVITSGGYERYFEEDGKTYHHIIDPFTGYPAENGLISVTIISKDGTLADGLSTALFVMGTKQATEYWKEHHEEFEAVFVTDESKVYVTEGLKDDFQSDYDIEIVRVN